MDLDRIARDEAAWDAAVLANGGHLLQSWRWGAFKDQFGWDTERVVVPAAGGAALAQILFRRKAGVSIGYIPRGPVLPPDDPSAAHALWALINRVARKRRALTIIVEPDQELPVLADRRLALAPGPAPIQPARTVKIDLADDETLLKQMHQKTRYNVRLAQRRGVTTRFAEIGDNTVAIFYQMLQDTADRNAFHIHDESYYRGFARHFGPDMALIFAEIEGKPAASVLTAAFGDEAIYMYGASSTKDRAHGAGFLIQYEAMRWARDRGCRRYDMWGIPAHDPDTTSEASHDRIAGTTGSDWRGLYEFKTRFGGTIVRYPAPLERRYLPLLAKLARRFYRPRGE
jgi:lipid II:glycine glycyltransferase (peptidoglycan interpeptide bridge formation enzyme)